MGAAETPEGESTEPGCLQLLLMMPIVLAFLYAVPFFFYPIGYALFDKDIELAIDIAKWNITHFPPSQGPTVRCMRGGLHTAEAIAINDRALEIGRQLETEHGYHMVGGTSIAVVQSLGPHGGLAHYSSSDSCIQIVLDVYDVDRVIRHEWAHIAAERATEYAAHGPTWREIARKFGASNASDYSHCQTADYECQPTPCPSYFRR